MQLQLNSTYCCSDSSKARCGRRKAFRGGARRVDVRPEETGRARAGGGVLEAMALGNCRRAQEGCSVVHLSLSASLKRNEAKSSDLARDKEERAKRFASPFAVIAQSPISPMSTVRYLLAAT